MQNFFIFFLIVSSFAAYSSGLYAQSSQILLNEPLDLSGDFRNYSNTYFLADSLASFDPSTASGKVIWRKAELFPVHAFNYTQHGIRRTVQNEFPSREYAADPAWPF
ncbi:MAG: hypothetical protein SH818_07845 [Saprospiraceae bacterium]|nr:hypothetical protein [Saprospiraceae bacterium]